MNFEYEWLDTNADLRVIDKIRFKSCGGAVFICTDTDQIMIETTTSEATLGVVNAIKALRVLIDDF